VPAALFLLALVGSEWGVLVAEIRRRRQPGYRPSSLVTALLGLAAAAALTVCLLSVASAVHSSSPGYQRSNDMAELGVFFGIVMAILSGAVTLWITPILVVRLWPNRAQEH